MAKRVPNPHREGVKAKSTAELAEIRASIEPYLAAVDSELIARAKQTDGFEWAEDVDGEPGGGLFIYCTRAVYHDIFDPEAIAAELVNEHQDDPDVLKGHIASILMRLNTKTYNSLVKGELTHIIPKLSTYPDGGLIQRFGNPSWAIRKGAPGPDAEIVRGGEDE